MNKEDAMAFTSQMDQLQRALSIYQKSGRIQKLDDSFTNLAFRMIVADSQAEACGQISMESL